MLINSTYYWTKYESIIQSEIMQGIVSGEESTGPKAKINQKYKPIDLIWRLFKYILICVHKYIFE